MSAFNTPSMVVLHAKVLPATAAATYQMVSFDKSAVRLLLNNTSTTSKNSISSYQLKSRKFQVCIYVHVFKGQCNIDLFSPTIY
jgi:hypothetical protein